MQWTRPDASRLHVRWRGVLLALLLELLATPAAAHPALWVVRDTDTTIYLFGTVHLLPHDTAWHFPALDRALDDSQVLYLEITDDDPAHMAALVLQYGMDMAHPLSGLLSPFDRDRLDRAARLAHVPGGMAALEVMRPWLAALTLTVAPLTQAGLDPAEGVDRQLRSRMEQAGKPVRALETAEEQIRFLADMPRAMQVALLRSTLRDTDRAAVDLQALIGAWRDGDEAAIARLENASLRKDEPALYQRLLVERNRAWAKRIAALLARPGTVFIAVGAAHLAGPDSVQVQLARTGIAAGRKRPARRLPMQALDSSSK
ncbi:MAG TPA: TraB/GumN family protein [Frateuria sp.]|uniref:TraB/GumN family protein n=1 Tax=Frateuria sp. TaxID=2211372 RepID=UPI002D80425D|nr:TraB/GumN family protein [Frateuria sp.]HET6806416.1 TraB/GumN family protein [Frateuria sp.]